MGNCISFIQCIRLLRNIEDDLDDSNDELLSSNLINEPSIDIDKKRKILGFSKKQNNADDFMEVL